MKATGESAMKKDGWHHWTIKAKGQRFWCRCLYGHDHVREPKFPEGDV